MSENTALADRAKATLGECSRLLIFDEDGNVLHSTFKVNPQELKPLTLCFGEREAAIRAGLIVQGKRYEVHRHHDGLVYGRDMQCEPEMSEGIAIAVVTADAAGKKIYALITYTMPQVSARMVTLLRDFSRQELTKLKLG